MNCSFTRWKHRHGFGIQSPWAYEFVRDVLFEKHRYYAFDTLQGTEDDEQLFRIVNWLQPKSLMLVDGSPQAEAYIHAAKADVQILPYDAKDIRPDTCLIIEDIQGKNRGLWEGIHQSLKHTSTFDLRHRGIAFFDPARQRQKYLL